jgi:uncharacterized protein YndB with AHSA1/START domain
MTKPIGISLSVCAGLLVCYGFLFAGDDSSVGKPDGRNQIEVTIDASLDQVWAAFTTNEDLKHWWAPVVNIDFKIGGIIQASYNPEATLGDASTIENTILSYDPGRMFSFRCTKSPTGFPFADIIQKTWTVAYFDAEAPDRTRIKLVANGYLESHEWKQMGEFFRTSNGQVLAKLKKYLETKAESQEP